MAPLERQGRLTDVGEADGTQPFIVAGIGHETTPVVSDEVLEEEVGWGILVGCLGAAEKLLSG